MQEKNFDWLNGFSIDFSLVSGLSEDAVSTKRYLSDMKGIFSDEAAFEDSLVRDNTLVYEFYEMGAPENDGDIAFGTSIVYPGKIGNEFFMTKGHFHNILETAEVYFTLAGEGGLLLENPRGLTAFHQLSPGKALYVPPCYAHRTVNTGKNTLVTFFAFRGDAGHDYGTIEKKGFHKLVVEENGGSCVIIDNPKWKKIT